MKCKLQSTPPFLGHVNKKLCCDNCSHTIIEEDVLNNFKEISNDGIMQGRNLAVAFVQVRFPTKICVPL
jgi:hypothetical protein